MCGGMATVTVVENAVIDVVLQETHMRQRPSRRGSATCRSTTPRERHGYQCPVVSLSVPCVSQRVGSRAGGSEVLAHIGYMLQRHMLLIEGVALVSRTEQSECSNEGWCIRLRGDGDKHLAVRLRDRPGNSEDTRMEIPKASRGVCSTAHGKAVERTNELGCSAVAHNRRYYYAEVQGNVGCE